RPNGRGRIGIGQVRTADRVERAGGDRERAIERIGAAMGADDVAVMKPRHRADHRTALARGRRPPVDGKARLALRMGGQADVIGAVGRHLSPVAGKLVRPRSGGAVDGGVAKVRSRRLRVRGRPDPTKLKYSPTEARPPPRSCEKYPGAPAGYGPQ